jgi:hypothetical protein
MSPVNHHNEELPTDEFLEVQSDTPLPIDAMHETLDAQPTFAVAARLLADQQHQAILHLDTSPDMYSQPITLQIPINRLPTLGFITHMDTTAFFEAVRRVHSAIASLDGGQRYGNQ